MGFTEDLEGTGNPQTYIVAAQDSTVTLIRVNPTPYKVTKLTSLTGLPSGKTWASAWSFKSTIFFAAEDGTGIVQLEMSSIHLNPAPSQRLENRLPWNGTMVSPAQMPPAASFQHNLRWSPPGPQNPPPPNPPPQRDRKRISP